VICVLRAYFSKKELLGKSGLINVGRIKASLEAKNQEEGIYYSASGSI
jgi:hypothetical protein